MPEKKAYQGVGKGRWEKWKKGGMKTGELRVGTEISPYKGIMKGMENHAQIILENKVPV